MPIHHDVKFTDLHQITKFLGEVQNMIDEEEYRQNNVKSVSHHNYLLYTECFKRKESERKKIMITDEKKEWQP